MKAEEEHQISNEQQEFINLVSDLAKISMADIKDFSEVSDYDSIFDLVFPNRKTRSKRGRSLAKWAPEDISGAFEFLYDRGEGTFHDMVCMFKDEEFYTILMRNIANELQDSIGYVPTRGCSFQVTVKGTSLSYKKLLAQLLLKVTSSVKRGDLLCLPTSDCTRGCVAEWGFLSVSRERDRKRTTYYLELFSKERNCHLIIPHTSHLWKLIEKQRRKRDK